MTTELRDGVWWFECTGVNAYLVVDGEGVTLIDAGTPLDAARIEAAIESTAFGRSDIDRILITHYDLDHVGGVAKLSVDVPVYVGRADAAFLTGDRRPSPFGRKGLTQFVTGPLISTVTDERVEFVDDGDEIGGFTAYHTPGHTPGHTAYVHQEREAAFLGDMVIERNGELRPAPWFISADVPDLRRSIREFTARSPDFEVAGIGHGTPFREHGGERLRELVARL